MLEYFKPLLYEQEATEAVGVSYNKTIKHLRRQVVFNKTAFIPMHCCNMCVSSRRLLQSAVNRQHYDDQSVLYFVCMYVANQSRLPQALVMVGCSTKKVHIDRLCVCVYMPEFRYVCVLLLAQRQIAEQTNVSISKRLRAFNYD